MSDEDLARTPPPKRKKVAAKKSTASTQKFRPAWLDDKSFKGWLKKSSKSTADKDVAHCTICNADITCGKSEITRHAKSQRHINFSLEHRKNSDIASYIISNDPIDLAARKIELKICAFLSKHYLPISLCEPFVLLLKSMFPNQDSLKKVCLGKQRASNIIRQVFGHYFLNSLSSVLRNRVFNLIVDETTDRSTKKQMSILAQYYDADDSELKCSFKDLVEVEDSSAQGLYNVVKNCLQLKDIPMENILSFCSDTTNVMMGNKHSFATLLKNDFPNVIIIKCSCHLIHLAASHACLKLPKFIEDFCRNVYSHFSLSAKRQNEFREFQKFVELEPHKILAPGQTRWLSLEACVTRLLEQWGALKLYFNELSFSDPTHVNDSIVQAFRNEFTIAYLEFLEHNLSRFNSFNRQFQSESPNFFNVKKEVHKLLKNIASDVLKPTYVRSCAIEKLHPSSPDFSVNLNKNERIYMGVKATETVDKLKCHANPSELDKCFTLCKVFLVESLKQIHERFQYSDPIYDLIECLSPVNASNLNPNSLSSSMLQIPQLRKFVDVNLLDREWREDYCLDGLTTEMNVTDTGNMFLLQGIHLIPNVSNISKFSLVRC